ncbi:hypothetical protein E5288_WYG022425 [Bos mutus]|uniref:Uncharacterized protein n=1 Tax=Bos mutus TaxID=72004 RepID=A0A6B0S2A7_9CETA|nr:hypothetical protein [Bos mutus]
MPHGRAKKASAAHSTVQGDERHQEAEITCLVNLPKFSNQGIQWDEDWVPTAVLGRVQTGKDNRARCESPLDRQGSDAGAMDCSSETRENKSNAWSNLYFDAEIIRVPPNERYVSPTALCALSALMSRGRAQDTVTAALGVCAEIIRVPPNERYVSPTALCALSALMSRGRAQDTVTAAPGVW